MDSPGGASEGHPGGGWVLRTSFDEDAFSLKADELQETTEVYY